MIGINGNRSIQEQSNSVVSEASVNESSLMNSDRLLTSGLQRRILADSGTDGRRVHAERNWKYLKPLTLRYLSRWKHIHPIELALPLGP